MSTAGDLKLDSGDCKEQESSIKSDSLAVRDEVFYFDCVIFKVENSLFRVAKNGFLVPGSAFEAMFSLPRPLAQVDHNDLPAEGTSDKNPIVLEDLSANTFRGFLTVMYPMHGIPTMQNWKEALDLSTRWYFPQIREKSIDALSIMYEEEKIPPGDIVQLGLKYRVRYWLIGGSLALVRQEKPLSISELCSSGLDPLITAKLLSIRESGYQKILGQKHARTYTLAVEDANREIPEVFATELSNM